MQKTDAIGATFIKAPKDSAYGKVFLNNMDKEDSFSDTKNQIQLMISNSKTAMFNAHNVISEIQEYRNCLVSKKFIYILLGF